jgi:hypothetical protein
MEFHGAGKERTLLMVADPITDALKSAVTSQMKALFPTQTPQLQLLDPSAFAAIQQLIEAGVLIANRDSSRTLYRSAEKGKDKDNEAQHRLADAREHLARSEHKRRMAEVLIEGGFSAEAVSPMYDAVELALRALLVWQGHHGETPIEPELIDSALVQTAIVPVDAVSLLMLLRDSRSEGGVSQENALFAQSYRLLSQAASLLGSPK